MDLSALIAVFVFATALLVIFGSLYIGASRSYARGELHIEGIHILRWGLLGHLALYILLAVTAFLK